MKSVFALMSNLNWTADQIQTSRFGVDPVDNRVTIHADNSFKAYWDVLPRPKTLPRMACPKAKLDEWLHGLGEASRPYVTLPAVPWNFQARQCKAWLNDGIGKALVRESPWQVLKGLLVRSEFVVDEPLRSLVDEEQDNLISQAFKAILEARFVVSEAKERSEIDQAEALSRWMRGEAMEPWHHNLFESAGVQHQPTEREKLDLTFFVLTLGFQNDLLGPQVFSVGGLEKAATESPERRKTLFKDLRETLTSLDHWAGLGCPTGLVLGLDGPLKAFSPKLRQMLSKSRLV